MTLTSNVKNMKHLRGSILIESMITASIVLVLLLLVTTSFYQLQQMGLRSSQKNLALGIIATQVEIDSQKSYDSETIALGTKTYSATQISDLSQLPNASLTRVIQDNGGTKLMQYILEWRQDESRPTQRVVSEYELTRKGIAND